MARKDQYRMAGVGFDEVLQLAAEIFKLEAREIMTVGKQPLRVKARSLLCYWAVRELGHSVTSVGAQLGLTQPAISRAVQRGERLVQEHNYNIEIPRKA